MKKTDMKDFKAKKKAVLEAVIPHMLDPETYPAPKISLEECAVLLARTPDSVPTRLAMSKAECSALAKMKEAFAKMGISRVSDVISV